MSMSVKSLMTACLFVLLGGASGSFIRYLLLLFEGEGFPFMLLTVNILGCGYAGLVLAFTLRKKIAPQWSYFHLAGIAGGTTTFAGFILVLDRMLQTQDVTIAIGWLALTLLTHTAIFALGIYLGNKYFIPHDAV